MAKKVKKQKKEKADKGAKVAMKKVVKNKKGKKKELRGRRSIPLAVVADAEKEKKKVDAVVDDAEKEEKKKVKALVDDAKKEKKKVKALVGAAEKEKKVEPVHYGGGRIYYCKPLGVLRCYTRKGDRLDKKKKVDISDRKSLSDGYAWARNLIDTDERPVV